MLIKGFHILVKPDCGQKMFLNEIPKVSFKNIKSLKDYLARFMPRGSKYQIVCRIFDRMLSLCIALPAYREL